FSMPVGLRAVSTLVSLERIVPINLITYSLTNVLTARRPTGMLNGQPAFAYNSFLRLKLENSYDINASHQEDGRPFSDIEADLYITPGRYLWLEADAAWSPYDHVFTNHNTSMNLWDERGDLFSATYRYTRETAPDEDDGIASISFDAQLMIDKSWRLTGGYEYNLYDDKEIESRLGVGYQAQCWGVDLEQVVGETSRSYYLVFHLKGLGSIGR
ncbi:MAG: LPS assembly protein LptD, partial [Desulfosarcinaceae bacterium]